MTNDGHLFEFYTRPGDDANVEVVVAVDGKARYIVECPCECAALAVIDQLVEIGLESGGGVKLYSRERRN